ncbi:2-keto-4-pentenoate hydratase/2-oxohepta-3-ene-1,7-dioic acid hydratase (catechol pathway) [Enhydrobacter aerosaccus]|uniref:2-keto-4-pentenoate hydratase/2-oxohepta-3-ene-1,7-dioic acid hydratase (Catechol pathway) n=1 Tax=Enhydrobacter aerosaccus TaxID=225324 RepID=A0A1T4T0S3_9HYPH|nr:fumarylacetoacetate hydrolase family protein [Enhydrobacter aerosaccus]SKA34012.1 2-keto-4-pentenoate hydratase/2-oxohepta-3-ene-1,7-dioic acid hydratase (catechol pathway) [Enhydrobacter aerosaccus]
MPLWARIKLDDDIRIGIVDGDVIHLHEGDLFGTSAPTGRSIGLDEAQFLTPTQPTKMVALWNNYRAAAEKNGWAVPAEPLYFIKTPNAFAAHRQPIRPPRTFDGRVVYEGELGVVIGKRCSGVAIDDAVDFIFGYTCINDMTAPELLTRDAAFAQWTRAKNFDGFGPFGPVVATDVDPMTLVVRTLVNGRERQNYRCDDMIFRPAELVSRLSQDMTLEPGDVIACGTSLGVLPIRPGTTVEVAIDGVGLLSNTYG